MGAIFGFTGPPDERLVRSMAAQLSHRGNGELPNVVSTNAATLAYLQPRLSSTPVPRGLHDEDGCRLALAGQLMNPRTFRDLFDALKDDHLTNLRGSFVLAFQNRDGLHLLRDGAGRRTLYWVRHGERWVFAIEPKAIHQLPGFSRRLRPAALAQYLTFSYVPGADTMLENLHEVPAGHQVTLPPDGEPQIHRWFRPEDEPMEPRSDEEWIESFRDLFGSAVEELLPPDKPAAIFLSGGIDSSIVTAEVAAKHRYPVHTFAIHFGKDYPNELEFARAAAERCGTRHEEVLITPRDFMARLPNIVWNLDEPIGDPVSMPNYELSRRVAALGFDRVLNGEGGDPCFGGPKNVPMLLGHWYGGQDFSPGFRERAYLASYRRAYEELEYLLLPEVRREIDPERDLEAPLTPFFEAERPARLLDKLLIMNMRLKGAHLILPKVERMLGSHGQVPLSPLFDERLIRLAIHLPGHLKLRNGIEKVVFKEAFRGRIPDSILDRPKSGMRVPVHYWFQGEMRRFARQLLAPKAIRGAGIFDEKRVRQLLQYDGEDGASRFGIRLWMLITFEIWRRLVIEGEDRASL